MKREKKSIGREFSGVLLQTHTINEFLREYILNKLGRDSYTMHRQSGECVWFGLHMLSVDSGGANTFQRTSLGTIDLFPLNFMHS
jgi:hypothetical protein